jgi:pimeloyl-ACP methyl ester carboxylesterase
MLEPTLNHFMCPDSEGGHRLAYWQWGNPLSPHVVVCVHGLTRQGRDFDVVARALCERSGSSVRVVCPDVPGRGQSDWLKNPANYQVPFYAVDMLALLGHLQPATVDWLGTSMGGLIGIVVAGHLAMAGASSDAPKTQAQPKLSIRRLVLNDVGPVLQWSALQRIGEYLGHTGSFTSLQQAADAMWAVSSSFGPHTPAQWLELSRHMVRPLETAGDRLTLHYDPAIATPFRTLTPESVTQGEAMLWQMYDAITADTLLTRGAQSDLLSPETAHLMSQRGPRARLLEFDGVGHAPTFVAPDQVDAVAAFLLAD